QRLARPAIHRRQRLPLARLEAQGALARGPRQDLERCLGDQAERAERPREQARHVVAGDVLHHRAAELQHAAAAVDELGAEHEIAHRARHGAARAGQAGGDAAAKGRPRPEMRRIEGQELIFFLENFFQVEKRSAAPGRDHQLGRVVADDPGIAARIENLAARHVAVEVLAAATAQAQRHATRRGLANPLLEELGQKRGRSACGNLPPCTCIRPYSAQRASVGTALPGLSSPAGSKTCLTARNSSSSSGRNCTHIWLIFSTPTPCSPVIVPPTATHFSSTSAAKRSVRSSCPASLASNRISGCRLPSPAWNTFGQRSPYFFSSAAMKFSTSPRRLRGMVPSMQ